LKEISGGIGVVVISVWHGKGEVRRWAFDVGVFYSWMEMFRRKVV